jgi:hypothetical protein
MTDERITEVAQWMVEQLDGQGPGSSYLSGVLYQDDAADGISAIFGGEFIYTNENGNPAIRKDVLKEFRRLRGDNVKWDSGLSCWERE